MTRVSGGPRVAGHAARGDRDEDRLRSLRYGSCATHRSGIALLPRLCGGFLTRIGIFPVTQRRDDIDFETAGELNLSIGVAHSWRVPRHALTLQRVVRTDDAEDDVTPDLRVVDMDWAVIWAMLRSLGAARSLS